MLVELEIKNILLMENLQIEFNNGFTTITGQTGAGKSIILDSIGIILGKRAELSILRDTRKQGIIIATFKVNDKEVRKLLYNNGFVNDDNEEIIIIKKIITKNGSKIFINDIRTTVQFVYNITSNLLEIYSQFEQIDLFNINKHLFILDNFGNLKDDVIELKHLFNDLKDAENCYQQTKNDIDEQKKKLEQLENFINDVENIKLNENEYNTLIAQKKQMVDSEKIATYIQNSYSVFNNAKIGSIINKIQDNLQRAECSIENNSELKKSFSSINEMLENIYSSSQITEELLLELLSKHNFNENDINEIENRISIINEVARKYNTTPYQIEEKYKTAKIEINKILVSDKILEKLLSEYKSKKQKYLDFACKLSLKRKDIAKKLEKSVLEKLKKLKMEKVNFFISFEEVEPNENGIDKVTFFASMNVGIQPAPIYKIASGGELSRFMLAFKATLCDIKNTSTIIFDEIDTGVSGSVAFAIGKEMQRLSKYSQVICITHNSQTASCADEHFLVQKEVNLNTTTTVVKKLTEKEKITAIAEMISGDEVTNEALRNAEMLIKKAHESL